MSYDEQIRKARRCPYCGDYTMCVESELIYGKGRDYGKMWACARYPACDAYVGCHRGTTEPLGRLADKGLREAKKRAHASFDKLWRAKMTFGSSQKSARTAAYKWLASQLGLDVNLTHIGFFDVDQCERVVAICAPYVRKINLDDHAAEP